jgi:zinc finger protein AEBP2
MASKSKPTAPLQCKWSGCEAYENGTEFSSVDELARHVRTSHVEPFESQDVVVCQWEKCKVFNVPSSSIEWLRRHVQQAHTKDRPFKCIMNGCIMSFNSREALQRHVNRHLEPSITASSSPASNSPQKQNRPKNGRGGKTLQGRHSFSSPFVVPSYSPIYQLYPNTPTPRHHCDDHSDSSYSSSEENGGKIVHGYKKPLCLKVRIPRRFVSLSSLPHHRSTPYNGTPIHSDVWDHKMMSVIRQACNQLKHDTVTSANLAITLKASVLGQRHCPEASEDELLVRWSPPL